MALVDIQLDIESIYEARIHDCVSEGAWLTRPYGTDGVRVAFKNDSFQTRGKFGLWSTWVSFGSGSGHLIWLDSAPSSERERENGTEWKAVSLSSSSAVGHRVSSFSSAI